MSKKQVYECETCKTRFLNWPSQVGERHFCSRQCKWQSMKGATPHNKGAANHISKPCLQCGKAITGMPSSVARRKYCTKKCFGDSLKGSIEKVLQRYEVDESTGCWLWAGGKRGGYGRIKLADTGMMEAHRASYEFHVGAIPDGLVIDHLCRNRSCINPAHLEPVTELENIRRGEQGSSAAMKKHWETRRSKKEAP